MAVIRTLGPADVATFEAFLERHADTSLFLRSNLRAAGIVDRGEPFQATYVGAFDGELVGVAAHCWNGNVIVQAPAALDAVVRAAVEETGRGVRGIIGPWAQLCAARRTLALDDRPARMESQDRLFALSLSDLVRPATLDAPGVHCRPSRVDDLDLITRWRVDYSVELLGAEDGDTLRAESRADMERAHEAGSAWLLEQDGAPVAYSGFNARLPDVVQIGGVFTPPAFRSRGWARAVVAGSLAAVAAAGVRRALLFTGEENVAARRAYEAIGFRAIGDYGLLLF
jgi:ribosomal protein S18 acetylase RimI-like enzyme